MPSRLGLRRFGIAAGLFGGGGGPAFNWYVDSVDGDDGNAGTSQAAPLKTLATLATKTITAGQRIGLKRGSIFRETYTAPSSGSAGSPIYVGAYGAGAKPVISGANVMTGFALVGGSWDVADAVQPNVVLINGAKGTYKTSKAACTSPGDWFWAANVLSVNWASDPSGIVEAGTRAQCLAGARNYLAFDNIQFTGNQTFSVYITGTNLTLQNCDFANIGGRSQNGIGVLIGANSQTVTGCTFANIEKSGIAAAANYTGCVITQNTISNCWNLKAYGSGGDGNGITAGSAAEGWIISRNIVTGCYLGISVNGGRSHNVNYNIVINCKVNCIDHESGTAGKPNLIYNNTIVHNPAWASGHGIVAQNTGDYVTVKNNLIYVTFSGTNTNVQGLCVADAAYTTIDVDYNLVYKATGSTADLYKLGVGLYNTLADWQTALGATGFSGKGAHDVQADPLLVNPASDYHLQALSPAIGAGVAIGGLTVDYAGNPVGNPPEIGAYEV